MSLATRLFPFIRSQRDKPGPKSLSTKQGRSTRPYESIVWDREIREYLRFLRGIQGAERLEQFSETSPHIGAYKTFIQTKAQAAPWRFEPSDDQPEDDPRIEFLTQCLFDDSVHPWTTTVVEATSCFIFGWAAHEIVLRRRRTSLGSMFDDGKLGIREFVFIPQTTVEDFLYSEKRGDWTGLRQQVESYSADISRQKLMLNQFYPATRPQSSSPLINAWVTDQKKNIAERVQLIGLEKDATGTPKVSTPSAWWNNASDENLQAIKDVQKMAENFTQGESNSIVTPDNVVVELMKGGGQKAFDVAKALDRYDVLILLPFLASHDLLAKGRTGSYSMVKEMQQVLDASVMAMFDGVCNVFNRSVAPRLLSLNNFDTLGAPKLTSRPAEAQTVEGEEVDGNDNRPPEDVQREENEDPDRSPEESEDENEDEDN